MTENESHGKKERKQRVESYLGQWHSHNASFFENNLRNCDGGGADRLFKKQYWAKMKIELFLDMT